MKNQYCIIMAGGIGSRFWPMSRTSHPKQFLDILGTGKTLLQLTYERFLSLCPRENIYVVTNEAYHDIVTHQLPNLDPAQVLSEPMRKNTAPCIAYASFKIASKNPEAKIVVAPSDHLIIKEDEFVKCINNSFRFIEDRDCLITLGIQPSRPDTGYGYIQFMEDRCDKDFQICKVKTFTEKPNLEMAKFFIKSGEFMWNSGIFVWSAESILKAIEQHLPDVYAIFSDGASNFNTEKEAAFIKQAYNRCPNISIDYGIMEKAKNVYILLSDFGWSDLGTWGSMHEHGKRDENENVIAGNNVMKYETKNCIINMPKNKLVVLQGLENYIVVESDDILLVCKRSEEQQIRQFVNDVKLKKGDRFI